MANKANSPAFLFYTGDFMTGTQFLSDEQIGKYLRLLMAQHQTGHLTEKQMLHICKSYDEDVFLKFIKDEEGKFFNERLEFEIDRRENFVASRSKNKLGKTKENEIISKSYEKHMSNHMDNDNDNKNIINKKDRKFEKPNLDDVKTYFSEMNFPGVVQIEAEKYFDYYESKGWKVGKTGMKDWRASVRNWIKNSNEFTNNKTQNGTVTKFDTEQQRKNDVEQLRQRAIISQNANIGSEQQNPKFVVSK